MNDNQNVAVAGYRKHKKSRVSDIMYRAAHSLPLFDASLSVTQTEHGFPIGVPGELPADLSKMLNSRVTEDNRVELDFGDGQQVVLEPEVVSQLYGNQMLSDMLRVKVAQCHKARQQLQIERRQREARALNHAL